MEGKGYRLGSAVALVLILLIGAFRPALANGWEHGAVPFETLIEALSFESPAIREQAAHSLGFRGQPEAVQPLLDRLALPEPEGGVRQAIYVALGQLGAAEALPPLAACVEAETSAPIRAHCIEALGRLGSPPALEIVLDALGRTGAVTAVAPVLMAFEAAAGDAERFVALRALAELRSPAATDALSAALEEADDPRLRAAIAVALGASRDGAAAGTLLAGDASADVRMMAARVLGLLHDHASGPALLAALDDPHALVRKEAALAAGDRSDAVREAASYALTLIFPVRAHDPSGVPDP